MFEGMRILFDSQLLCSTALVAQANGNGGDNELVKTLMAVGLGLGIIGFGGYRHCKHPLRPNRLPSIDHRHQSCSVSKFHCPYHRRVTFRRGILPASILHPQVQDPIE